MARCCASPDARFTPGSPKPLKANSPRLPRAGPRSLAHHCTEAGLIEKAAGLWGKAGQRSLDRSALVEAAAQLTRALEQIATLPGTPALRREQIKLQVALITPLMHVKGYAATETKAAAERARLLIEQAEALGEPAEDPLLLFSVLYAFWVPTIVAFNGDVMCDLAAQFLALAEKQKATVPLMIGHRLMGSSLVNTGDIAAGRAHLDQAIALYDLTAHRPLATRFGQDVGVAALSYRSFAMWVLGYPKAALRDNDDAVRNAREIGQAATLMYALHLTSITYTLCGNYVAAAAQAQELVVLAEEKGSLFWKALGMADQGCALGLTGRVSDAIETLNLRGQWDTFLAILFAALGPRSCGAWAIRGGLALHRRSDVSGGNNQGKMVRGRSLSRGWRNCIEVPGAGGGESANVF